MNTTYCVIIENNIKQLKCPLPSKNCSWQHAVTNNCCYSFNFVNSEFTVNDLADLTSNLIMTNKEIKVLQDSILTNLKISLVK